MNTEEMRNIINRNTRAIAYNVFNHTGEPNFIKAYEKLMSMVMIDWGFNIAKRLKASTKKYNNLFDYLHDDELEKVYKSSMKLMDMYKEVYIRLTA